MKIIKTRKNQEIYVDDEDYDLVNQFIWRTDAAGYAVTSLHNKETKKCHIMKMHKLIMGNIGDFHIDHKNHDKLDNRRSNIRKCTPHENYMNKKHRLGSVHPYKGVRYRFKYGKWKWYARCRRNDKHRYSGGYDTIEEAALAYNRLAIELFGEFAAINIVPE